MKAPFLARKTHKWIALILGVQVTFWMLSGAYMAVVDIDFIHGDSLVRNLSEPIFVESEDLYSLQAVLRQYSHATRVELVSMLGEPHYIVMDELGAVLVNAINGDVQSPIQHGAAISLAKHYYAGAGEVVEAILLTDNDSRPTEIQSRPLPLWQIKFNDSIGTTFYISPHTGELVSRRHTYWRLYDFLWMFHIMDYENRSDFNNNLLRVAAFIGISFALSGVWLLVYALKRRKASDSLPIIDQ